MPQQDEQLPLPEGDHPLLRLRGWVVMDTCIAALFEDYADGRAVRELAMCRWCRWNASVDYQLGGGIPRWSERIRHRAWRHNLERHLDGVLPPAPFAGDVYWDRVLTRAIKVGRVVVGDD